MSEQRTWVAGHLFLVCSALCAGASYALTLAVGLVGNVALTGRGPHAQLANVLRGAVVLLAFGASVWAWRRLRLAGRLRRGGNLGFTVGILLGLGACGVLVQAVTGLFGPGPWILLGFGGYLAWVVWFTHHHGNAHDPAKPPSPVARFFTIVGIVCLVLLSIFLLTCFALLS
jgi:hypothetical protein